MNNKKTTAVISSVLTLLAAIIPTPSNAAYTYNSDFLKDWIKIEDVESSSIYNPKCEALYIKTFEDHTTSFMCIEKAPDSLSFTISKDTDDATIEQLIKEADNDLIFNCWKNTTSDRIGCSVYSKDEKGNYTAIDSKTVKELNNVLSDLVADFEYYYDLYVYKTVSYEYLTAYSELDYDGPIEKELEDYIKSHKVKAKLVRYSDKEVNCFGNTVSGNKLYIIPDDNLTVTEHLRLADSIADETGIVPCGVSPMEGNPLGSKYVNVSESLYGDANCDGNMNMADDVMIMQSIAAPDKYKMIPQGEFNADVANTGDGITNQDANAIQRKLLGLTD